MVKDYTSAATVETAGRRSLTTGQNTAFLSPAGYLIV